MVSRRDCRKCSRGMSASTARAEVQSGWKEQWKIARRRSTIAAEFGLANAGQGIRRFFGALLQGGRQSIMVNDNGGHIRAIITRCYGNVQAIQCGESTGIRAWKIDGR